MSAGIKIGIIGGAGYTGGELVRLLVNHPDVKIEYVVSKSQAGKKITELHTDLLGEIDLAFSAEAGYNADVIFLCLPHGESKKYLHENSFLTKVKVIDLSRDFRASNMFVYGLPELNKSAIAKARHVANPGCFATAIQLGLLPLAAQGHLQKDVHVNATTGSTGAGQSLSETTHFTWRNNNLSAYRILEHEHLPEITQSITKMQNGSSPGIHFVPQRGAFTRGILAAITAHTTLSLEKIKEMYTKYYTEHPFVHLVKSVDVKQVANTNKCFLQLEKHKDQLVVISVIDNLLKGASGQAVQNMNLMFGLEETAGLKLKASAF
jgi:N-acetyl-gamma-glutamyl-phosphate reductase